MLGSVGPMGEDSLLRGRAGKLMDRRGERGVLDQLIDGVRAGGSGVLVVRGEPGVGKSALLDYLARHASGCRVVRVAGVQSEMELAFAGLHQLLSPMLDHLERLPVPQREALRTAFGVSAGPVPDRFLVGLAVLGLLAEVAGEQPLICVVDDEQWLDRASAQALGFVARRLAAEPVGLVFAARVAGEELAGLPELTVEGLPEDDARALLDSAITGPVDKRVRDLVVAEARGNPLALLEWPRGLTPGELAGGFGLPGAVSLPGRIEESFGRQLGGLPEETRRRLLLAAADPSGDALLVWRAAGRLGIGAGAGVPAVGAGLVEFGVRVRFRHPLARSAAYRSAPFANSAGCSERRLVRFSPRQGRRRLCHEVPLRGTMSAWQTTTPCGWRRAFGSGCQSGRAGQASRSAPWHSAMSRRGCVTTHTRSSNSSTVRAAVVPACSAEGWMSGRLSPQSGTTTGQWLTPLSICRSQPGW
jgi:AAA ATPase domain